MAWPGYFTFGGEEIINVTRTETYARHAGLGWFKPVYRNEALPLILGETYVSPLMDDAPWTDPDILASYDFYGAYPLDVTGIENSTVTATIVESTQDGGVVQKPRFATKAVVFSAVLVGGSEAAVAHGMHWLTTVLNRCGCLKPSIHGSKAVCGGEDLQWLSSEPQVDLNYTVGVSVSERTVVDGGTAAAPGPTKVDGMIPTRPGAQLVNGGAPELVTAVETTPTFDLTDCLPEYLLTMHKVTSTTGPTVIAKASLPSGGEAWTVEWTLVAGDPSRYGYPNPLIQGFLDPHVPVPYQDGIVPPGGVWDAQGYVTSDPSCPVTVYQPLFDPTCALLVAPPVLPTINPACFEFSHVNFRRRMIMVPKQEISLWWATVPIITIYTPTVEVRNMRIQFFEDDDGDTGADDPCNPIGDIVFSYVPANSILTFDGVSKSIYADVPRRGRQRADSVATNSSGGPFDWPELSCGCAYVVVIDMEQTQVTPVVDLTLVKKAC